VHFEPQHALIAKKSMEPAAELTDLAD